MGEERDRSHVCVREAVSRRGALGRISAASVAAMVGVQLAEGHSEALPVVERAGAPAGPSTHRYPLPPADGVTIDRDTQLILVRFQHHVYAFNLACPHENTALRWKPRDGRFQCPRHESRYQPDGTFIDGRATRNMDRFAVRLVEGTVEVDLGRLFRSDQQPKDWAAADLPV